MRWADQQWNARYEEVKAYHVKYGNLRIPVRYASPSGVSLSHWLADQRQRRKKDKLSEECIAKLNALGIYWGDNVDPWEKRYSLAKAYYEANGNLRISREYVTEDRIWLGKWLYKQRQSKNLTQDQIKRLKEIGIDGRSLTDMLWDEMYDATLAYQNEHGTLNMPKDYRAPNGNVLGIWLRAQRRFFLDKNSGLSDSRRRKLEALTDDWNTALSPHALWNCHYAAAKAYYEEHGDLLVPLTYVDSDGIELGAWLSKIRYRQNPQSELTYSQVIKLNKIGMVWESKREHLWDEYYETAKQFYLDNGDLYILEDYVAPNGLRLGYWVYAQQRGKSELSEDKIAMLDAIGMIWISKHELAWERFYKAACEYHKQHGSLDMPKTYKAENGMLLGRWLKHQRRLYAQKDKRRLTDERIQRLTALGMIWAEVTVTQLAIKEDNTDIYPQKKPAQAAAYQ